MPTQDHLDQHHIDVVACAVVSVSDTRTRETDKSGRLAQTLIAQAGHETCQYDILPDDANTLRAQVEQLCESEACHVVLLIGGTGLAGRDVTYEAITGLFEKRIDGFGELFRTLSFEEIGPAAMLSRAAAGIRNRTPIFSMPGSTNAVKLACKRLILPKLGHMVGLVRCAE